MDVKILDIIIYIFLIFFIYSVLGWIVESIFVSLKKKKVYNRGFLIGPYCPIYGIGSLVMVLYIQHYRDNLLTVFILSLVLCSAIEYIVGFLLEKLFKARWWDYSDRAFNLNGRICGENSLLFGLGGIFIVYISQPIIDKIITNTNSIILIIITILFFVIITIDTIISCKIIGKLKDNLANIEVKKDSTSEIKKLVQDVLSKSQFKKTAFLENRLIKAFPGIDLSALVKIKDDTKKEIKKLLKKK